MTHLARRPWLDHKKIRAGSSPVVAEWRGPRLERTALTAAGPVWYTDLPQGSGSRVLGENWGTW